jgi:cytoskeletal protein CcmA (bactofilin family)
MQWSGFETQAIDASHDTLVIDPVRMNIVNRIAAGAVVDGDLNLVGGLLLQGTLKGQGTIDGHLVVWHSGQVVGHFVVRGELYVLGHLGGIVDDVDSSTEVTCHGTAFIASTGVCTGTVIATSLRMYDGATLQGPFRTRRVESNAPYSNVPSEDV